MWLFFCYTVQLITIKLCTKFQNPNSSSCWEIFDRKNVHMYYIRKKEGKNKNMKKESKMRISIFISMYTLPSWRCTQNLKTLAPIGAEKSVTETSIGEKEKNEQINGLISSMWLFFCYTIQLITIKLCTKFQNPNPSSCWEIFDGKKSLPISNR